MDQKITESHLPGQYLDIALFPGQYLDIYCPGSRTIYSKIYCSALAFDIPTQSVTFYMLTSIYCCTINYIFQKCSIMVSYAQKDYVAS